MRSVVTEIAPDVFRLNQEHPGGANVSCFVIRDEQAAMVETNLGATFPATLEAVRTLLDPETIRYFFIPCFAMDECGALNKFLSHAPKAEVMCSPPGAMTLSDFLGYRPRVMADGERVELGAKSIQAVLTPWAPQLDSMVFYEEADKLLFSSDLFITHHNAEEPVTSEDCSAAMVAFYQSMGTFPSRVHLDQALDKIEALDIEILAGMHGSLFCGDLRRYFTALRHESVAGLLDSPFYERQFDVGVGKR